MTDNMTDKTTGIETAAIRTLKRAVTLDNERRFKEAKICYEQGIEGLLDVLKVTSDAPKKQRFRDKIEEYMKRAEQLQEFLKQDTEESQYNEQIHIENNSQGYSYERIFSKCIDESLTEVEVQDPYIRSTHQCYNFLRFCELLVKSKGNVKHIKLITGMDNSEESQRQQTSRLTELTHSLEKYSVKLTVEYSNTLHDREIKFNSGWIVKIGRGLDYFKATPSKFCIGYCDFDLRQCHETTVDIFHSKHTKSRTEWT